MFWASKRPGSLIQLPAELWCRRQWVVGRLDARPFKPLHINTSPIDMGRNAAPFVELGQRLRQDMRDCRWPLVHE